MPATKNGRHGGPDLPDRHPPAHDRQPPARELTAQDTLGGRISLAREAIGLTATQAARRLGVMPSSWNAWERDRAAPRANRLANMAGVLGVSLSWLLSGEGQGPRRGEPNEDPAQLLRDLRSASLEVAALNERMQAIATGLERLQRGGAYK